MFILMRTTCVLLFIVLSVCEQYSSNNEFQSTQSSETLVQDINSNTDKKHGIKIGSSGFSEFKGNLPIDQSSFVSSINVGSFVGQTLRSSSVLREAQLHSAASRAELFPGTVYSPDKNSNVWLL